MSPMRSTSEVATTTPATVVELLQSPKMLAQIRMALPKHITPERLARIALTQLRQTPRLMQCTRESLLGAIMECAQLGLEPGTLGQCWLVPYGKEATFILGYRGMAQLAWRSSLIASISARAVFEGDVFAYDFGSDKIEHQPSGDTDPAKLSHAWAAVHTTNGGRLWDVMTRSEIDKIRTRSAAGKSGPWVTDYAEMAKKTVLRRLFKLAPLSPELQTAMVLDDAADQGISQGLDFDLPEEVDVTPDKDADLDAAQKRLDKRREAEGKREVDPQTGEEIPDNVGREPTQGTLGTEKK